jgi:hypothetical protein
MTTVNAIEVDGSRPEKGLENWRRRADSNRCIEAKRLKTRSDTE